eukprot:scaffold183839_cov22-Tisochrysis_lutea.AAC.1
MCGGWTTCSAWGICAAPPPTMCRSGPQVQGMQCAAPLLMACTLGHAHQGMNEGLVGVVQGAHSVPPHS